MSPLRRITLLASLLIAVFTALSEDGRSEGAVLSNELMSMSVFAVDWFVFGSGCAAFKDGKFFFSSHYTAFYSSVDT